MPELFSNTKFTNDTIVKYVSIEYTFTNCINQKSYFVSWSLHSWSKNYHFCETLRLLLLQDPILNHLIPVFTSTAYFFKIHLYHPTCAWVFQAVSCLQTCWLKFRMHLSSPLYTLLVSPITSSLTWWPE